MDFLKKNWSKLTIAILLFLAGLVYVIALIQTDDKIKIFEDHALMAAAIVFFLGMTAYYIAKMLNQKWAKYVLLGVGIIATVFSVCGLIDTISAHADMVKLAGAANTITIFEYLTFTGAFTYLVVFGLIPLVKGIKKMICCCCEGDKKAAAPAPAKAATSAPAAKK